MGYFKNAQICLNGHAITSDIQYRSQPFCSKCGAKTISKCPHCDASIHGEYHVDGVFVPGKKYIVPSYCHHCGNPYPWTEQILNNAVELLALDDELDEQTKELIKTAIPDLLVDTPATPLATAKYQKGISRAGSVLKNSFYQLLVDVVSETVKKTLFL